MTFGNKSTARAASEALSELLASGDRDPDAVCCRSQTCSGACVGSNSSLMLFIKRILHIGRGKYIETMQYLAGQEPRPEPAAAARLGLWTVHGSA